MISFVFESGGFYPPRIRQCLKFRINSHYCLMTDAKIGKSQIFSNRIYCFIGRNLKFDSRLDLSVTSITVSTTGRPQSAAGC